MAERGERLGPWRLTALRGEGPAGALWDAKRDDGAYEAQVLVRLTSPGHEDEMPEADRRARARLNHPHLARLLDAGRTPQGMTYAVTEARQGRPLLEAAQGLGTAARLRLALQLAEALAHAHRQGLVHGQLLPEQVLLDDSGQVQVLDSGLEGAWRISADLSPADDVRALGLLLQSLLAGPGAAPGEGVARADLDAVLRCTQGLAAGPRYFSADALAADLRALLQGRPVSAREPTPAYLARRFVGRHRGAVLATLLAALAVLAAAVALGATAAQARGVAQGLALLALAAGLAVSSWQARAAAQARDEARARLADSNTLVREVLMRYADMATFLPGGLRMKADLLKDTLAHLERLRVAAPQDPGLAGEAAKAYARLSDMQLPTVGTTLAEPDEAEANAELALTLFPLAEPAHRQDPEFHMWWARALRTRSTMAQLRGDPAAALEVLRQRLAQLDRAIERFPDHHSLRFERASTLLATGQMLDMPQLASLDQPEAALEAFAAAEAGYQALVATQPEDSDLYYELGGVADMQLLSLHKLGRLDEARAAGERAVRWRDQALALKPEHTSYRLGTAGVRNNLVSFLLNTGQTEGLLGLAVQGEAAVLALEKDDPASAQWTSMRRLFALQWGRAMLAAGQPEQALPRLQDAIDSMADARTGHVLVRRAIGWLALARAQAALGLPGESQASAAAAEADLRQRLAEAPADARAAGCLQEALALRPGPPPAAEGAPTAG